MQVAFRNGLAGYAGRSSGSASSPHDSADSTSTDVAHSPPPSHAMIATPSLGRNDRAAAGLDLGAELHAIANFCSHHQLLHNIAAVISAAHTATASSMPSARPRGFVVV